MPIAMKPARNQSRATLPGIACIVFALALMPAGMVSGQPQPQNPGESAKQAGVGKLPIKAALEQKFLAERGRSADKVQWLEIDQGQSALTALRRNLSIQSTQLSKDLSAAALQQALALFDPVVTLSAARDRSFVINRTLTDLEFRGPITCDASGVCTRTLATKGVFSMTFDQGRAAGFAPTEIEASKSSPTGDNISETYSGQMSMLFPKGITAFATDSLIYKDNKFLENIGFDVVGSYGRPWTNQFNAGITAPLPGSRFFGDYAAADVALRIADTGQQTAFWQIASLINDTLLQVEQGYWNLVLRKKIYEATVETRERVRALAAKTDRLFASQEATRYDKAKVDAQTSTLRRQEQEALNNYLAASNALTNLLDLDKDTILLPACYEARLAESAPIERQEALQQGAERNPRIRLAEVNRSIAAVLHEQSRVQLGPDLSATASFSRNQSNSVFGYDNALEAFGQVMKPDSKTQNYSLNYTRPWDNRAANANFLQAAARLRQQEILLGQTRRSVASQVTLAVTNLQSARQRTELASQSRDLAARVFERAERQRTLGVVSDFEVIVKSIELLNADLEYQTTLLGRKISEAAVHAAIGSLAQRYGEGSGK
ncbi:MAG: TolC family protein [Betaproteobacteria bacterium]|nr:TolC family protein [Betaproteobacteria bacterium]